jgi:hypothetical protein
MENNRNSKLLGKRELALGLGQINLGEFTGRMKMTNMKKITVRKCLFLRCLMLALLILLPCLSRVDGEIFVLH